MKRIIFFMIFFLFMPVVCQIGSFNHLRVGLAWAGNTSVPATINHQQLISKIAQADGKVVVLNFWASWCPPCRMEIPGLMHLRKKYSDDEVLILGVSVDENVNMLNGFLQKNKINYPVFWATADVSFVFGVSNLPRLIVYNQEGEKVFDHEGYVSPEQLKAILDSLLAKK